MCKICQNRDGNNSRHAIDEFQVDAVLGFMRLGLNCLSGVYSIEFSILKFRASNFKLMQHLILCVLA